MKPLIKRRKTSNVNWSVLGQILLSHCLNKRELSKLFVCNKNLYELWKQYTNKELERLTKEANLENEDIKRIFFAPDSYNLPFSSPQDAYWIDQCGVCKRWPVWIGSNQSGWGNGSCEPCFATLGENESYDEWFHSNQ